MFVYKPSEEVIEKAERFAGLHEDCYSDSQQFSRDKKKQDKFLSKIAEVAVQEAALAEGCEIVSAVNFEVIPFKDRKHGPDLVVRRGDLRSPLSVKFCSQATVRRYGASWTYQYHPRPDPIFRIGEDDPRRECFVIGLPFGRFGLVGRINSTDVIPLFRDPVKTDLKGHKKVLYLEDLQAVFPDRFAA